MAATSPSSNAPGSAAPGADDRLEALSGVLLERGLVDDKTLERARRVAAETGQRLDAVLTQLGLVSERGLAESLSAYLALPLVGADRYPDAPLLQDRLKPRFLRKVHALPIAVEPDRLVLAMADPLDPFTRNAVAAATGRAVAVEIALPIELEAALNRLYPESGDAVAADASADSTDEPLEEDAERLKDLASEAPVIRLVNQMIARAVETQASDIHIEPFEDRLRVRYRYDGVLHEAEAPPTRLTAAITSRIKIMSRLDIAERRLPQDGRLKLAVRGQEVDFRVSTIPSLYGETVVLRVLDRTAVEFDYAKLGLPPVVMGNLQRLLDLPNGMVLVTGPTGSGKTTTLYTGLLNLNSVARKIVTVEDPIEYQLSGINQIQVKPQIGLNFAHLLRSILRQDPDVIMIGEIRDLETAQIAVQASLTGHLVLSTLHTNSAAATVTRLRDMGLEDYLITAVVKGVLAQRLVRRLCPQCKRPTEAPPELVERFSLDRRTTARPIVLHHPVGCPHCRDTGYRGRQAIAELLIPNDEIERLIFARADHAAIERAAIAGGMTSMFDAGLDAALAGITTVEEVVRSIRAEG
ncbi:GspE/PulE family protein [Aliidongia dinghuensis]|uniref:GspE/PulE family protein n=1 Tax=Aliidongia dinghuensis TaxID=1867774 RepID=UPI001E3F6BEC|nr:ATPase, T2SS/T4P/T4SS family [Aliidongia dinghuensis]